MKGFIAALALLVAVGGAVGVNAHMVKDTQATLSYAVEQLSAIPCEDAVRDIQGLRQEFEKAQKTLCFSINFYTLDRVAELLASLEAYARTGNVSEYASTHQLLQDALQDLARLEHLSWKTVF